MAKTLVCAVPSCNRLFTSLDIDQSQAMQALTSEVVLHYLKKHKKLAESITEETKEAVGIVQALMILTVMADVPETPENKQTLDTIEKSQDRLMEILGWEPSDDNDGVNEVNEAASEQAEDEEVTTTAEDIAVSSD